MDDDRDSATFYRDLQHCFYNIQKLKLDFSDSSRVGMKLIELLVEVLRRRFLYLSHVDMNLASCELESSEVADLINILFAKLPNLKSLKLNIKFYDTLTLTKERIIAIANALKKGEHQIKRIRSSF